MSTVLNVPPDVERVASAPTAVVAAASTSSDATAVLPVARTEPIHEDTSHPGTAPATPPPPQSPGGDPQAHAVVFVPGDSKAAKPSPRTPRLPTDRGNTTGITDTAPEMTFIMPVFEETLSLRLDKLTEHGEAEDVRTTRLAQLFTGHRDEAVHLAHAAVGEGMFHPPKASAMSDDALVEALLDTVLKLGAARRPETAVLDALCALRRHQPWHTVRELALLNPACGDAPALSGLAACARDLGAEWAAQRMEAAPSGFRGVYMPAVGVLAVCELQRRIAIARCETSEFAALMACIPPAAGDWQQNGARAVDAAKEHCDRVVALAAYELPCRGPTTAADEAPEALARHAGSPLDAFNSMVPHFTAQADDFCRNPIDDHAIDAAIQSVRAHLGPLLGAVRPLEALIDSANDMTRPDNRLVARIETWATDRYQSVLRTVRGMDRIRRGAMLARDTFRTQIIAATQVHGTVEGAVTVAPTGGGKAVKVPSGVDGNMAAQRCVVNAMQRELPSVEIVYDMTVGFDPGMTVLEQSRRVWRAVRRIDLTGEVDHLNAVPASRIALQFMSHVADSIWHTRATKYHVRYFSAHRRYCELTGAWVTQVVERPFRLLLELRDASRRAQGKACNQSHALHFARGAAVVAFDCNMDALLSTGYTFATVYRVLQRGTAPIVGFTELNISKWQSQLGAIKGEDEEVFADVYQGGLAHLLRVRLHYGHPDMFDITWVRGYGGMSKASANLNTAEDIYSGFRVLLLGLSTGHCSGAEAMKAKDISNDTCAAFEVKVCGAVALVLKSRDVFELNRTLPLEPALNNALAAFGHPALMFAVPFVVGLKVTLLMLLASAGVTHNHLARCGSTLTTRWLVTLAALGSALMLYHTYKRRGADGLVQRLLRSFLELLFRASSIYASNWALLQAFATGVAKYIASGRDLDTSTVQPVQLLSKYNAPVVVPTMQVVLRLTAVVALSGDDALAAINATLPEWVLGVGAVAGLMAFSIMPPLSELLRQHERIVWWLTSTNADDAAGAGLPRPNTLQVAEAGAEKAKASTANTDFATRFVQDTWAVLSGEVALAVAFASDATRRPMSNVLHAAMLTALVALAIAMAPGSGDASTMRRIRRVVCALILLATITLVGAVVVYMGATALVALLRGAAVIWFSLRGVGAVVLWAYGLVTHVVPLLPVLQRAWGADSATADLRYAHLRRLEAWRARLARPTHLACGLLCYAIWLAVVAWAGATRVSYNWLRQRVTPRRGRLAMIPAPRRAAEPPMRPPRPAPPASVACCVKQQPTCPPACAVNAPLPPDCGGGAFGPCCAAAGAADAPPSPSPSTPLLPIDSGDEFSFSSGDAAGGCASQASSETELASGSASPRAAIATVDGDEDSDAALGSMVGDGRSGGADHQGPPAAASSARCSDCGISTPSSLGATDDLSNRQYSSSWSVGTLSSDGVDSQCDSDVDTDAGCDKDNKNQAAAWSDFDGTRGNGGESPLHTLHVESTHDPFADVAGREPWSDFGNGRAPFGAPAAPTCRVAAAPFTSQVS